MKSIKSLICVNGLGCIAMLVYYYLHINSDNEMYQMWSEYNDYEESYANSSKNAKLNYFFFNKIFAQM